MKKTLQSLECLIEDFQSGYIANPSARADRNRDQHLRQLMKIVEKIKKNEIISNILGEV